MKHPFVALTLILAVAGHPACKSDSSDTGKGGQTDGGKPLIEKIIHPRASGNVLYLLDMLAGTQEMLSKEFLGKKAPATLDAIGLKVIQDAQGNVGNALAGELLFDDVRPLTQVCEKPILVIDLAPSQQYPPVNSLNPASISMVVYAKMVTGKAAESLQLGLDDLSDAYPVGEIFVGGYSIKNFLVGKTPEIRGELPAALIKQIKAAKQDAVGLHVFIGPDPELADMDAVNAGTVSYGMVGTLATTRFQCDEIVANEVLGNDGCRARGVLKVCIKGQMGFPICHENEYEALGFGPNPESALAEALDNCNDSMSSSMVALNINDNVESVSTKESCEKVSCW